MHHFACKYVTIMNITCAIDCWCFIASGTVAASYISAADYQVFVETAYVHIFIKVFISVAVSR